MHEIPSLPYKYSDLLPYIDEVTMRVHHLKHHQAYTDKLNTALEKYPELREKDVTELIRRAEKDLPEDIRQTVINNGGGFLNHNFFWNILHKPLDEENLPNGTTVGVLMEDQFGSYGEFKNQFKEKALSLFGSGWTWLLADTSGNLSFENTANQNLPPEDSVAILTADMWEHAYYLKYQNQKADYLDSFFHVINWKEVDQLLKKSGYKS